MQWIAGIEADNLYAELATSALAFSLEGLPLHYCGLGHLRAIKQAAADRVTSMTSSTCQLRNPDGFAPRAARLPESSRTALSVENDLGRSL